MSKDTIEYMPALNNLIAMLMVFQGLMLIFLIMLGYKSTIGSLAYGFMMLTIVVTSIHALFYLSKSKPMQSFAKLFNDATK